MCLINKLKKKKKILIFYVMNFQKKYAAYCIWHIHIHMHILYAHNEKLEN
jgi:hypothetical protein